MLALPGLQQLLVLTFLALLFQLFGKARHFVCEVRIQCLELIERDSCVNPLGIQQQVFELLELLLGARRITLLLFDLIFKTKRFVSQISEFLF